jgi:hypothetical protein
MAGGRSASSSGGLIHLVVWTVRGDLKSDAGLRTILSLLDFGSGKRTVAKSSADFYIQSYLTARWKCSSTHSRILSPSSRHACSMQARRPLTSSLIRRTTTTPAIYATSTTVIYELDLRGWNCLVVDGEPGYHDCRRISP